MLLSHINQLLKQLCICVAVFCFVIFALYMWGVRYNNTGSSLPAGFYMLTGEEAKIGDLALFCPPDTEIFRLAKQRGYVSTGLCEGGYQTLIKRLVAQAGDTIQVNSEGIAVNNELLKNSAPITTDSHGRTLPQVNFHNTTLTNNSVLMMSDYSTKSFDGRYFGPIDRKYLKGKVKPIWVFGR